MRHRQAIRYLPDLGSDSLDSGIEEEIIQHAGGCPSCREWLFTRAVLERGLVTAGDPSKAHPDSESLALWIVRPEEIHEPDRERLRQHLETCVACRDHAALMKSAVDGSRSSQVELPAAVSGDHGVSIKTMGLLAAAVAILVLVGGLILSRLASDGSAQSGDRPGMAGQLPTPGSVATESASELSTKDLEGTHVIGSERRLDVSRVTVRKGAVVTLHAGEVVALGDGFRVSSGARLIVSSGPHRPTGRAAPVNPSSRPLSIPETPDG